MAQDLKKLVFELKDLEPFRSGKPKRIDENIRKKILENDAFEQDIKLKRTTLKILFSFLGLETVAVFAYSYFQATHFYTFNLEEWSFKLLITATIVQITYMVRVAVLHLFPRRDSGAQI